MLNTHMSSAAADDARRRAFAFRGSSIDLRAAGERLGVRTVLEGSIRRSGKRLRVSVQLADVRYGVGRPAL